MGCRVWDVGCRVQGVGCRVQGVGCEVQGVGCGGVVFTSDDGECGRVGCRHHVCTSRVRHDGSLGGFLN